MPAPVRYRSTAAVYDEGWVDWGATRARGSRSAPPLPSSVTGLIATSVLPFRHCRSKCVSAVRPECPPGRSQGSPQGLCRSRSGIYCGRRVVRSAPAGRSGAGRGSPERRCRG